MSRPRARITTVVQHTGAPSSTTLAEHSQEVVPLRKEIYNESNLKSMQDVGQALQRIQDNVDQATQPARSLISQGGTEWPSVAFVANVPQTFAHKCEPGLPVKTTASVPRGSGASTAVLYEVSQNATKGTVTLCSTATATFDIEFTTRPGVPR